MRYRVLVAMVLAAGCGGPGGAGPAVDAGAPDAAAALDAADGAAPMGEAGLSMLDAEPTSAWSDSGAPREGFCDGRDVMPLEELPTTLIVDTTATLHDQARPSTTCTAASGVAAPDLVFAFTPPVDGVFTMRTDRTGTDPWFDTVVYVRSGCAADGAELGCNDDAAVHEAASRLAVEVPGGNQLYAIVDGAGSTEAGQAEVTLDFIPAPPLSGPGGETCAEATELIFSGEGDTKMAVASGDTTEAANDGGCTGVAATMMLPDLFYAFTIDDERDVVVEVAPDRDYDAAFYVLRSCDDAEGLACIDAATPGTTEAVELPALPPGRYLLGVDAFGVPEYPEWHSGSYELRLVATRP